MPRLEYFIVSESISVDQRTNRVSVFNVVDELQVSQFPATIPQVVATSAWNREPSDEDTDYQAMLRIYPPAEDTPKEFTLNFRLEKIVTETFTILPTYPFNSQAISGLRF